MLLCNWHKTPPKTSIENHFQTAGDRCDWLPRQQRQELPLPRVSGSSIESSHVRCVGEPRLWFLRLCRPVGFISGCAALLLDILLQRRHLLFSSRNLTAACDQSLPVKRKQHWSVAVALGRSECFGSAAYSRRVVCRVSVRLSFFNKGQKISEIATLPLALRRPFPLLRSCKAKKKECLIW